MLRGRSRHPRFYTAWTLSRHFAALVHWPNKCQSRKIQQVRNFTLDPLDPLLGLVPAFYLYPQFVQLWCALGVAWKSIIYLAPAHLA